MKWKIKSDRKEIEERLMEKLKHKKTTVSEKARRKLIHATYV